ncbi:hypothetical protein [Rhizobium herbae]|uniref:Tail tape measure protein n=1 Tax=Rhizobium herbae TaxID=508661 RepID=A0ABS4EPA1_9HYPH|nr:hypothetical protein [Rhizobium herbae]MBP1859778.1 hypothetical protein [Rhizobium herbae]
MRDMEFNIRANDKTKPAFDAAGRNAKAFNGELDMATRGYNMAANAARLFAAGFTLTAVADFGRTVRGVITDAADLVDLADKVGVATGDLQRMVFGFSQAGVAASDIDQILTQWSKRIGEAHTKGGQLADIFKANGVSLTDSEGRLRSSVDLMRDYAELVANAGSEQEQMTLSTLGFGRAGGAMVLVLKDGKDGWDQMMRSINKAGGALEDDILRQAAEIDDDFNQMWQTFETGAKRATLNAVGWLANLQKELAAYSQARNAALAGQNMGELGAKLLSSEESVRTPTGDRPDPWGDRFGGDWGNQPPADDALAREIRSRYSKKTVITGGDEDEETRARGASTKAIEEQKSAYERLMERLKEEQDVLGLSGIALRIKTEQQRANVDASSDQGRAIAKVVTAIETQQAAYESAAEASEFFNDALKDGFSDLIPEIETGNQALDRFLNTLIEASASALLFGSGPLSGLFGGGKGLFGGFGGGRAIGGTVDPWSDYLVGENGPEIMRIGSRGGRVGSVDAAGSGVGGAIKVDVGVSVDDEGNLKAYVKSVAQQEGSSAARAAVTDYDKAMPGRVQQINRNPRRR